MSNTIYFKTHKPDLNDPEVCKKCWKRKFPKHLGPGYVDSTAGLWCECWNFNQPINITFDSWPYRKYLSDLPPIEPEIEEPFGK